ncbi:MAG TPA: TonB-dependent receptor [Caulobacteraceae bacterium]|jgi:vitamin B12 transporter
MKRWLFLSTALVGAPAAAQQVEPLPEVEEVVVTAARLAVPVEHTPGARVVTEAEIERRGAVVAGDVLETIPGINIIRNGGLGGVTYIRQRGQAGGRTLVLVDGVPVNDPSLPEGGFDLSSFELADVARLEVLSGPQGALWGSEAIGGVIGFTTREPEGVRIDAEAGSYSTARAAASAGRSTDAWAFGVSASGLSSDGFSKAADGTEDDGFDTRTLGVSGRYAAGGRITVDGRVRYNAARVEIDGYDANFAFGDTPEVYDTETLSGFVRARVADLGGLDHAFSLSALETERVGSGGGFPYAYDAERRVWRYTAEHDRPAAPYGFVVGAEREDTAAALSDGSEADLGASAAFGVLRLSVGRLTAHLGARWDDPDRFDGQATGRASAAYDVARGFSLRAAYGQGFRTPSISQAACDFCFPAGPADLRPERAQGVDLGGAWRSGDGRLAAAVTAYRLDVRDQIEFVSGPDFTLRYENLARTRTRGVEAEASADFGRGLAARAAYAWTDAEDRSDGARLLRVPEHQGSLVLSWIGATADAALTIRGESDQVDTDPSTLEQTEREGFLTADLAASRALTRTVRATLRVENLFDSEHQQVLGYREPGRSAYVGVRLRR